MERLIRTSAARPGYSPAMSKQRVTALQLQDGISCSKYIILSYHISFTRIDITDIMLYGAVTGQGP
jgi:hypothetical protein